MLTQKKHFFSYQVQIINYFVVMMATTIKLSHRQNQIDRHVGLPGGSSVASSSFSTAAPTLFLHGLDSSSHTWRNILNEITTPAVAVDLRGCGSSDLGNPNEFTPDAIVEDIQEFVSNHEYFQRDQDLGGIKKMVICGHSMVRDGMIYGW